MQSFTYPARFTRDRRDGGYVVTFRDLPEAITQGDSVDDGLEQATGALQAAVEARIMDRLDIPSPSKAKRNERLVALPLQTALKAALFTAMKTGRVSRVELARRMRIDEKEARRMLDPHHVTKADRLERALHALGKRAEVRVSGRARHP